MIILTPSGDILLEGLGKVGEWRLLGFNSCYYYEIGYVQMTRKSNVTSKTDITKRISVDLYNGFTPKKWEE